MIVNGHSLGGALAILAAVDIKLHFGRVNSVYTFGQPRVGNS
jgi:predicted lipase